MTKKCLFALILMVIIAGSAFTQSAFSLSVGAGGYFTNDFGGGIENSKSSFKIEMPYMGGGCFAFFDATFAELSVGMLAANGTIDNGAASSELSVYGLDIGLFGKIPVRLGERFTLFPLLGANYRIVLDAINDSGAQFRNADGNKKAPADLNAFWFKAGAGLDLSFNEALYLRGEALYGFRLANKYETDAADNQGSGAASILGHGLTVTFALGYRFN